MPCLDLCLLVLKVVRSGKCSGKCSALVSSGPLLRQGSLPSQLVWKAVQACLLEVKVEATNFVGYLTLSWPVQVRKVDPVNVSGSYVTREAEGDLQGGSKETGTS